MLMLRRFEEKAGQLYGMGLIGGFCHLYIGQEAVAVGIEQAISRDDPVITSYRCHAHAIARGVEPRRVLAELTGRGAGISKGKGGSMHMFSPAHGFWGGHGIVAAQVPIGTGIAFALKYRASDRVCITYFGDGAANQGQVFEAYNMAALWKLPVVYVIENNQYAMGTSVKRATADAELYRRAEGFGIPGLPCDGMDVIAVRAAAREAVSFVRAGNGPMVIEAKTYRYRGHSMSDPAKYRSREEVQQMREARDPIEQVKARLVESGSADDAALKEIDKEVRAVINDAAEFAQNAPEPDPSELATDVTAGA
ncbi:MAG TPA: pyruvate dehydrogenase (acetyl-transferring) E1 component subunit alpha [Alphaproteobacteria bacterium]